MITNRRMGLKIWRIQRIKIPGITESKRKPLDHKARQRVRIMHIKREQKGAFFNGNESVLYMLKMNLLYRRIMFEVLGIDEAIYKNSLLKCVSRLDEWNGILKGFLSKLSL